MSEIVGLTFTLTVELSHSEVRKTSIDLGVNGGFMHSHCTLAG